MSPQTTLVGAGFALLVSVATPAVAVLLTLVVAFGFGAATAHAFGFGLDATLDSLATLADALLSAAPPTDAVSLVGAGSPRLAEVPPGCLRLLRRLLVPA